MTITSVTPVQGVAIAGPAGRDGNTILRGPSAPSSGVGVDGDWYVETTHFYLFGPKTGGSWPDTYLPLSITGPKGERGASVLYGAGPPTADDGRVDDFWIDVAALYLYGPKTVLGWPAGAPLVGPQGGFVEWTGEPWSADTIYTIGAGVDHLGSSFVSLRENNVGHEPVTVPVPATSTYWQLTAAKGDGSTIEAALSEVNANMAAQISALRLSSHAYALAFGG